MAVKTGGFVQGVACRYCCRACGYGCNQGVFDEVHDHGGDKYALRRDSIL